MADDQSKVVAQDPSQVDRDGEDEGQGRARKFSVSAEELRPAVKAVGRNAADVQARLEKR